MPVSTARAAGSGARDNRWKLVEVAMRRHGNKSHALIETLHAAQESYGFLDEDVLRQVAKALRVPLSKVYGAATFYSFFSLKPAGRHSCVVCTGTACYIKGADTLLDEVQRRFGVAPGETTPDGQLSVISARCFGSCGLAPAVVLDGEMVGRIGPEQVVERLSKWTAPQ